MPTRKPFYNDNDIDAIRKISNDEQKIIIREGKILSLFADGTAKVQLIGSATTLFAETTKNTTVLPGDFVFLIRSMITSRWYVLTSATIQNMTGVLGGASGGSISGSATTVTAPNSITVQGDEDKIVIQWTPSGVQSGVIYQLSIADDAIATGEVLVLVPGGSYIYYTPANTTKYFKVRSIDKEWNTSGWTIPISGTATSANIISLESLIRRERTTGEFLPSTFRNLYIKINNFIGKLTHANTANRTYTFPDNDGTVALTTDQPDLVQIEMFARRPQIVTSTTASGGTGDVVGPGSSTDSDFAQFDGTTGKLIKDGGLSLDTDGALAADSDLRIPSQKAVKTYADSLSVDLVQIETFSRRPLWMIINLANQVLGLLGLKHGGTGVDLSASGSSTAFLAQDASHIVSARSISASDVPNLDASKITSGQLAVARGGTHADLSATGGTSKALWQESTGADVTVRVIADSDLPAALAGHTISGGTIDNTPIGTTTRALGYFTALREYIGGFAAIFTHANSADRTYTFPDNSGTVALTTDQDDLIQIETFARRPLSTIINLANQVIGILKLRFGGTGADLSATGGSNQFVKQSSAGAVLTVGTITDADVPDALTISGGTINNTVIGATTPVSGHFATDLLLYIGGFFGSFTHANTAGRTYTFPDQSGNVLLSDNDQFILGTEIFN